MLRNIPLATVCYEIHFDCPYTQLNATFIRTKVKDDRLGRLLKSPIFVIQKAAAPKNGAEFCQKSIGADRCSLARLYDDWQRQPDVYEANWNRQADGRQADKPM